MEFRTTEAAMLLFATIGPLKVTIVCASLTAGASPAFQRRVAARSVTAAFVVCMVFALLGELILRVFSVSVPAFQIAGGIIVLLFSIQMVMGKKEKADAELTADPPIDIAIYPLGIPLMASVSGLVAIVSLLAQNDDLASILKLSAMIAAIMAINYVSLRASGAIVRAVGPAPIEVVGKIMGVILAALAIELMLMGLSGLQLITLPPRGA